jgi:hypothetical protein
MVKRLGNWRVAGATVAVLAAVFVVTAADGPPDRDVLEAAGLYMTAPPSAPPPDGGPTPHRGEAPVTLLLIPDSTADRVMAFDPTTGDLVNADFIPADSPHMQTAKNALAHADNASVLVADQISDVVQRYSAAGAFMSTFAPAGGVNNAIMDNSTGAAYRPAGNLVVCVQGGTNGDSVAEFDAAGAYVGNFIAIASGGLDGPFDVHFRASDVLVTSINTDQILRYDRTTGAYLGVFAAINNFPQQIAEASNGNVLVANFSGTEVGIVEYTSAGAFVGRYNPAGVGGNRGVYELPNGNLLTTNGTGVYEVSRAGALVSTKITGVSGQYIELVQGLTPVGLQRFTVE